MKRDTGRIGLALGSGGARGWAHIGVINAIHELGMKVHCVAGTSMGALVGAAYAAGKLDTLEQVAMDLDWKNVWRYFSGPSLPRAGLVDGARIVAFIGQHVSPGNIEALRMPYAAVATEVTTGEEIVIRHGSVMEAVRASIAIPGLFTPCVIDGRVLVDGGLVNPLPVSVARALGADTVIAVDITRAPLPAHSHHDAVAHVQPEGAHGPPELVRGTSAAEQLLDRLNRKLQRAARCGLARFRRHRSHESIPAIFDICGNSMRIFQRQITATRLKLEPAELVIAPDVQDISTMAFPRAAEAIQAGYAAARAALAEWGEN